MKAVVYQDREHTTFMEMGEPVCGEDFCDNCGDCLVCHREDCNNPENTYCEGASWVIYEDDAKNPFKEKQ